MSCETSIRAYATRLAPAIAGALDCSETDARDLLLEVRELATNRAAAVERPPTSSRSGHDRFLRLRQQAEDARATEATAAVFRTMQVLDPPIAPPAHGDADPDHGVSLPLAMSERYGWQEVGETIAAAREGRMLPSLAYVVRAAQLARRVAPPEAPSPDLEDVRAMPAGYDRAVAYTLMAAILTNDAQREAVIGVVQAGHTLLAKPAMIAALLPHLKDWSATERDTIVAVGMASARCLTGAHRLQGMAAMFPHLSSASRAKALADIRSEIEAANRTVGESLGGSFQIANHDFAKMPANASSQASALAQIAPHLSADEARQALAVATTAIRGDKDQLYAVVALAARLEAEERAAFYVQHHLVDRSHAVASDLLWDSNRIDTFLSAYAAQEGILGARRLVAQIPAAQQTAGRHIQALTALIALAPEAERAAAFTAALAASRNAGSWVNAADSLIDLLPHAPDGQRAPIAQEAFAALRGAAGSTWHTHQIGRLLPHLPPECDEELLAEIRGVPRETRPFLLAAFARHREDMHPELAKQVRAEAIRLVRRIRNPQARGTAMAMLRHALHVAPEGGAA